MKAVLKASKSHLVGWYVDWLIHELTHNMIIKYKYNQNLKERGFISNKKVKCLIINSILQSLKILDSYRRLLCKQTRTRTMALGRPWLRNIVASAKSYHTGKSQLMCRRNDLSTQTCSIRADAHAHLCRHKYLSTRMGCFCKIANAQTQPIYTKASFNLHKHHPSM